MEFDSKRAVLGSSKTPGGGEAGKGKVGGEHEGKFKARAKHNFSPSRKFSCGHTSSHPCSAVPRLTHSPNFLPLICYTVKKNKDMLVEMFSYANQ